MQLSIGLMNNAISRVTLDVRNTLIVCCIVIAAVTNIGCQMKSANTSQIDLSCALEPNPPHLGNVGLTLRINELDGSPLTGAVVHVEANMNHPGMRPTFADLKEIEPGHYRGQLTFTMCGDWFLLVTATTNNGGVTEQRIDVPGVKLQ